MHLAFSQFSSNDSSNVTTTSPIDSQPLLILHGLFGSKRNWQSIAKAMTQKFGTRFTIFTLDLRNHGESGHSDSMSYQDMAYDVLQFMHEHQLQNITIIGHSIGGKVAMQMALQAPQSIRRMVVIDIAPIQYQHDFSKLIDAMSALPLDQLSSRSEADHYLRSSIRSATLRQFLLQNLYKSTSSFCWRINLQAIQSCMNDILDFPAHSINEPQSQQYQSPVLFLKGEHSDYITRKGECRIFEFFPRALFITVAKTGHWPHAENPQLVIQEIGKFVAID